MIKLHSHAHGTHAKKGICLGCGCGKLEKEFGDIPLLKAGIPHTLAEAGSYFIY